MQFNSFPKAD